MSPIVIGAICHPPDAPSDPMVDHLTSDAEIILQQNSYAGVVTFGDLNTFNDELLRDYPLKQFVCESIPAAMRYLTRSVHNWLPYRGVRN